MRVKETTVENVTETEEVGEVSRTIRTIIVRIEGFEGDSEEYVKIFDNIFKD